MAIATVNISTSCVAPDIEAREMLGSDGAAIRTIHYRDFIGPSSHGEVFDFQECAVDGAPLSQLTQRPSFAQAPDYAHFQNFYKSKLAGTRFATWLPTPLDSVAAKEFNPVLRYGNLQEDENSRNFLRQQYLTKPGSFYAYFNGCPVGLNLYVLVPATGQLFIIRKRG